MKSKLGTAIVAFGIAFSAAVTPAAAAPTAQFNNGYTLVEFFPEFVAALTSLQIAPSKNLPATLYQRIGFFPITGGRLDASNARGEIPHAGGLKLTKASTQVILSDFVIDTAATAPRLTGIVTANGSLVGRIPLFNVALPQIALPLVLPPGPEILLLEGSRITLTQEAATALNGAFATSAFTAGFPIGIASIYGNY
jgi:hypothetical protein